MKGRIIFLVEEPSMKILLDRLLPRLFPGWHEGKNFLCVKHEGKSDLDKSIPRKLKAWKVPNDRFVIVRDNDSANCTLVKRNLAKLCSDSQRPDTLIRLVCQELESWYLGDLQAIAIAFDSPQLVAPGIRKKFADPDRWQKPSVELSRLLPAFQKGSGARAMAEHLSEIDNISHSYRVFVQGVRRVADEMGYKAKK
jgi:Domain of unknown function (DUF4276)